MYCTYPYGIAAVRSTDRVVVQNDICCGTLASLHAAERTADKEVAHRTR